MPNPDPRPLPTEPPDSGSANKPPITEPEPDRLPDEAPEPNPDENDGVPKTAGVPPDAGDTSRSRVANRDAGGPRKAGLTPRPTPSPLGED